MKEFSAGRAMLSQRHLLRKRGLLQVDVNRKMRLQASLLRDGWQVIVTVCGIRFFDWVVFVRLSALKLQVRDRMSICGSAWKS